MFYVLLFICLCYIVVQPSMAQELPSTQTIDIGNVLSL